MEIGDILLVVAVTVAALILLRILIAFLAGAASALALSPINAWPVPFITFPILVWLVDGAAAGRLGHQLHTDPFPHSPIEQEQPPVALDQEAGQPGCQPLGAHHLAVCGRENVDELTTSSYEQPGSLAKDFQRATALSHSAPFGE